jgi:hypothetical protein
MGIPLDITILLLITELVRIMLSPLNQIIDTNKGMAWAIWASATAIPNSERFYVVPAIVQIIKNCIALSV